jgi:hypothetical protein
MLWKSNRSGCRTRFESGGNESLGFDYSLFRHLEVKELRLTLPLGKRLDAVEALRFEYADFRHF